eukprot:gene24452-biopygen5923
MTNGGSFPKLAVPELLAVLSPFALKESTPKAPGNHVVIPRWLRLWETTVALFCTHVFPGEGGGTVCSVGLACAVVRYTVPCRSVPCCAVLSCVVLCCIVRCGAVRRGAERCGAVRRGAVRCGAARRGAARRGTARRGAVWCGTRHRPPHARHVAWIERRVGQGGGGGGAVLPTPPLPERALLGLLHIPCTRGGAGPGGNAPKQSSILSHHCHLPPGGPLCIERTLTPAGISQPAVVWGLPAPQRRVAPVRSPASRAGLQALHK